MTEKSTAAYARRQQLDLWRQQTGRTPMKRFSYVQECYLGGQDGAPPRPKPCPPSSLSKSAATRRTWRRSSKCPLRRVENLVPRSREGSLHPDKKPKLSRREMLEEWLATHGSTVKKPRSYLPKKNGSRNQNQAEGGRQRNKKRIRRHTIGNAAENEKTRYLVGRDPGEMRREALKEQFQRDIEDTIAGGYEADPLAVRLQFEYDPTDTGDDLFSTETINIEESARSEQIAKPDCGNGLQLERQWSANSSVGTPTDEQKVLRPHVHFDRSLVFESTAIRYTTALSEPRKRRHSCATPGRRTLHLTPVRRSTRENRKGPGFMLDQQLCMCSPSEAQDWEEFEDIEVLPNGALLTEQIAGMAAV